MMGAVVSRFIFIFIIFGCLLYTLFSRVIRSAMPQLYASHVNPLTFHLQNNAKFANTVLRSMFSFGFLFGPLIGAYLIQFMGYAGLFGTVFILLFTLILQIFFYKDLNLSAKSKLVSTANIEKTAPNMLKDKTLFIPFIAFILLHIGQWMYTMNIAICHRLS